MHNPAASPIAIICVALFSCILLTNTHSHHVFAFENRIRNIDFQTARGKYYLDPSLSGKNPVSGTAKPIGLRRRFFDS